MCILAGVGAPCMCIRGLGNGKDGRYLLLLSGQSENTAEKNERERIVERLVMYY